MKLHIEFKFHVQEYWLYFYQQINDAVVVFVPDPEHPGEFANEYARVGTDWSAAPTLKLNIQMYELLKDQLHPEQEKLTNLMLKNYEREQARVDKLMDHVMRLES